MIHSSDCFRFDLRLGKQCFCPVSFLRDVFVILRDMSRGKFPCKESWKTLTCQRMRRILTETNLLCSLTAKVQDNLAYKSKISFNDRLFGYYK